MDPKRFQAAYRRLQNLDERLTHKVRPRSRTSLSHATQEQLEGRVRDLSEYTLELKEIVDDMFQAIAAAPAPAAPEAGPQSPGAPSQGPQSQGTESQGTQSRGASAPEGGG